MFFVLAVNLCGIKLIKIRFVIFIGNATILSIHAKPAVG